MLVNPEFHNVICGSIAATKLDSSNSGASKGVGDVRTVIREPVTTPKQHVSFGVGWPRSIEKFSHRSLCINKLARCSEVNTSHPLVVSS